MKRYRSILWLTLQAGLFFLAACGDEDDTVIPVEASYTDPEEKLAAFRQQIMEAENGWNAILEPQAGKMYRLFFEPGDNGQVALYTDASAAAAQSPLPSKYRLKITESVNPALVFEEGSNLDELTAVDKAYSFRYSAGDSLYLVGNRYGDRLTLFKATAAERESYEADELGKAIGDISGYLSTVRFLYMEPEPGRIIQLVINRDARNLLFTYVDGQALTPGADFSYTTGGIFFNRPLDIGGGAAIQELRWDESGKKLFASYNGSDVVLSPSSLPVIPLHYLLGNEYSSALIAVNPDAISLPGWSPKFKMIWITDDNTLFDEKQVRLYYIEFDMDVAGNAMDLNVYFIDGASTLYLARFPYTFTLSEEGAYAFNALDTDPDSPYGQNAGRIREYIPNILGAVNKNTFRMGFYDAYDNEEVQDLMARFDSVEDSDLYFTTLFY